MAKTRGGLGIVSLILLAAALLFMFFVVLAGVSDVTPLNKTYFLQADTSAIPGARPVSQWTYFYVCGSGNTNCGKPVPALPIGYAWVGNSAGAPTSMVGHHGKGTTDTYYYYMWRFGWVFYLMSMFFTAVALFFSLIAPCSRLASGFSGLVALSALFFYSIAAALMTATFVKARDAFRHQGHSASIGRYAFGWTWGAWAAIFIASILLLCGCVTSRHERGDNVRAANGAGYSSGNRGFFRRQRSRKSARGSFVDNESQRRVKDEYA